MKRDFNYFKNNTLARSVKLENIDPIIQLVIEKVNRDVTIEDVKSNRRTSHLVEIRFYVYWICKYIYKIGVKRIGVLLNRDHSAIIKGIEKLNFWYETYPDFKWRFDRILKGYN